MGHGRGQIGNHSAGRRSTWARFPAIGAASPLIAGIPVIPGISVIGSDDATNNIDVSELTVHVKEVV